MVKRIGRGGSMQTSSFLRGNAAERLAERYIANRRIYDASVERLSEVWSSASEARERSLGLRVEVRSKLDVLVENILASKEWRSAVVRAALPPLLRPASKPDPVDTARHELHEVYAASGDAAIRSELMASYDGFARSLALKFRHRESADDLIQVARIGLLHAIDRFDPALGRPFPLFARITITGELKRHIRDKTWSMRVPRSLQEDYLSVMQAVDELTGEQADSPTMEAVADRCGLSVERVIEAMELRVSQRALSIDAPKGGGSDEAMIDPWQEDAGFGRLENQELLGRLLSRLSSRDRRIIELRFVDELTQAEIAEQVGVSQMCVSRVLARTLGRLRLWARTALT